MKNLNNKKISAIFWIALVNFALVVGVVMFYGLKKQESPAPKNDVKIIEITPTKSERCIVTVDGIFYDVTEFRNLHKGGDIFQCGTDMSAVFHGQHSNDYLKKMARYQVM